VSLQPGRTLWRLGYHASPPDFPPRELYAFNHRFDDIHQRFRTLYCAEFPETCLREVLADFRPNLGAWQRHIDRYGPEAADDFVTQPVTAQWRAQHTLVPVEVHLAGPLVDLTDVPTRQQIEDRHLDLLLAYDLEHLDLHEITTRRRPVTQTIAADLFDRVSPQSAFRRGWTETRALRSLRAAAPWPRSARPLPSPTRRPSRSSTLRSPGASSSRPQPPLYTVMDDDPRLQSASPAAVLRIWRFPPR
jgi:hypothetical protein